MNRFYILAVFVACFVSAMAGRVAPNNLPTMQMRSTSVLTDAPISHTAPAQALPHAAHGGGYVNGKIINTPRRTAPTGHYALPMPVLASSPAQRANASQRTEVQYTMVNIPKFNLPFAAAKVAGGKTAEQTLENAELAVRQNGGTVPPPPNPDDPPIPLSGAWLIMQILALAYGTALWICSRMSDQRTRSKE